MLFAYAKTCENKGKDQLLRKRAADQCFCFCYKDSTIPLLPKSENSSLCHILWLYCQVCIGPGQKPRRQVFLTTQLILKQQTHSSDCADGKAKLCIPCSLRYHSFFFVTWLTYRERGGSVGLRSKRSGVQNLPPRVVSLSKTLYSPKVQVIPRKRWLCLHMTEKLLTGMLNLNTNKHGLHSLK